MPVRRLHSSPSQYPTMMKVLDQRSAPTWRIAQTFQTEVSTPPSEAQRNAVPQAQSTQSATCISPSLHPLLRLGEVFRIHGEPATELGEQGRACETPQHITETDPAGTPEERGGNRGTSMRSPRAFRYPTNVNNASSGTGKPTIPTSALEDRCISVGRNPNERRFHGHSCRQREVDNDGLQRHDRILDGHNPEATRRINLDRGIADVNGGIGATIHRLIFCHLSDQWVRTTLASKLTDSAQILDGPRKDA